MARKFAILLTTFIFFACLTKSLPVAEKFNPFLESTCPKSFTVNFESNLENSGYKLIGFSGLEDWGRWIDGRDAIILLPCRLNGDRSLSLVMQCYGEGIDNEVRFKIGSDAQIIKIATCERGLYKLQFIEIDNSNKLILKTNFSSQPYKNGHINDHRNLSVGLTKIIIE